MYKRQSINGIDVRKALSVAISNTHLPDISLPNNLLPDAIPMPGKKTLVYKWKDAAGVWNFSIEKPDGFATEVIELAPDRNVVQAVVLPQPAETDSKEESGSNGGAGFMKDNQKVLFPYSPGQVRQLIEDAKGVQKQVDDRYKRLEETVER
ncbi:MAG: DUF4124 domain-containing protein [Porticoccaceae bacterium]|nr:DUF4124 domain-containing protein [Porticoccaceae bacterium]